MPKNETVEIQKMLVELGTKLGFEAYMEEQIHGKDTYAPIYDVVWYLNLEKMNAEAMRPLFGDNQMWFDSINRVPFAGFEVEGSTTSSKNQLSNFANLYSGNFIYNFVIVNNAGAGKEADTYRRGNKLNRYFLDFAGLRNTFFFDKVHLEKSIEALNEYSSDISVNTNGLGQRGKFGGETASVPIFEQIKPLIEKTGFQVFQNWSPEVYTIKHKMLKNMELETDFDAFCVQRAFYPEPYEMNIQRSKKKTDSYYIPKLDLVMGFNAPKGFVCWIRQLAYQMKYAVVDSPILYGIQNSIIKELFIPLISIEIESSINKHLNGGIFNMSKNSYLGILVTKENAEKHLQFFKNEMGIKNVICYCTGDRK